MEKDTIKDFEDYLSLVSALVDEEGIILYRGQTGNYPLLPSIVRINPTKNTEIIEKAMLTSLKRRAQLKVTTTFQDDWDWLVYAQHYGMKTKLLDWTSNPLVGLWFACSDESKLNVDSFVYVFVANNGFLINRKTTKSPFVITRTRILRPALNNERIVAQAGWFTAHVFSNGSKKYVPLEKNTDINENLWEFKIPANLKKPILKRLSIFGINYQSLFPDISGICKHLNWTFEERIK